MKLSTLFLIIILTSNLAPQGVWLEEKDIGPIGVSNYKRDVGNDCLIKVHIDSSVLKIYDNVSAQWHTFRTNLEIPWTYVKAGDSVALAWNASILVGYSALTASFNQIPYSSPILGGYAASGVETGKTMICVLTEKRLYIFDGDQSCWDSLSYEPLSIAENLNFGIYVEANYVLVNLYDVTNVSERALLAYSRRTKTFWQFYGQDFEQQRLSDGFVFWLNHYLHDESKHFIAGWSANSGEAVTQSVPNPQDQSGTWPSGDLPGSTFLFLSSVQVEGNIWRHHMYAYDTNHHSFELASFDYTYNNAENYPSYAMIGYDCAIQTEVRVAEDNTMNYHIYDAKTHSFRSIETEVVYGQLSNTNIVPSAGNRIVASPGSNQIFVYDIENEISTVRSLPEPTQSYQNLVNFQAKNGYAVFDLRRPLNTNLYLYTYNKMHPNRIVEYNFSVPDKEYGYLIRWDMANVHGYLIEELNANYKILLYSPFLDTLLIRDLNGIPQRSGAQRDFIYWADANGTVYVFDGVTALIHPIQVGVSNLNRIISRDGYLLLYTTENNYIGYSTHTRTIAEPYFSNYNTMNLLYDGNGIELMQISGTDFLVYNAIYNTFISLKIEEEYGNILTPLYRDNTALIMTTNGNLFAFNPHGTSTSIKEKMAGNELVMKFDLKQNYPNPFNPKTVIRYSLSGNCQVELSIYNLFGQKIVTLVSAKQQAGVYTLVWDASAYASGVYLYRLTTDQGFGQTKKLILLK